jgi:hypothetical protein
VDFSISAFNVKESDEIDWYDEIDLNKTNCTKETFDKYFKEEIEHENKTSSLSEEWMKKGKEILTEDKWEYWDKIVPIRLEDLYSGRELGCCLDIVKILNNNGSLDEAKKMINNQHHSEMSYRLVCHMVRFFCNRGQEFIDYIKIKT